MADLQEFITDITRDDVAYCAVCFRTEKERKLVSPVSLAKFLKITNLGKLSEKESTCIYCERQAEVALKLYKTLCFARDVNCMLWSLVDKKMTPRGIAYLLPSKVRGQNSGPGSVKRNKLLSSLRRYQTFAQTDVLIVDASSSYVPVSKLSVTEDDSILIEDDDDVSSSAPRLVPIEKLLENPQNVTQASDKKCKPLVLYPVKTTENSEDQYLIVPDGVNLQLDGNTLSVVNNGPTIPVLLPNGNIISMSSSNNQIILPINDNVLENHSITIKNNAVCINEINTVEEIILPDKGKIGEKIKILPKNTLQIPNNGNSNILLRTNNVLPQNQMSTQNVTDQRSQQQGGKMCQKKNFRSEETCQISNFESQMQEISENMCQITNLRSLQEDETRGKPPEAKKKSDPNIDWEDKIPMDVISFMDARDPHAPSIPGSNAIADPLAKTSPRIQISPLPQNQPPVIISSYNQPPRKKPDPSRLETTLTQSKWGGFERSPNEPPLAPPLQTCRKKPDASFLETALTKSKWGGIPRGKPPQAENTILSQQLDLLVPCKRRSRPGKVYGARKRKSDDDVICIS